MPARCWIPAGSKRPRQFIQGVSDQRPAPRRDLPLCPLALCRYRLARRLQIRRPHDRRALGGTGPADRARSLRPARRLRAGRPPLRGPAAAPARPLLPHPAAQPDHGGPNRGPRLKIAKTTPCKVEWDRGCAPRIYLPKSNNYLTMASIEVRHVPARIPTARSRRFAPSTASTPASSAFSTSI